MSGNALLEEKLRRALRGFYAGDAYGRNPAAEEALLWTENGDIVALLAVAVQQAADWKTRATIAISDWASRGITELDKPAEGLSTVAERIIRNPDWRRDPVSIARKAVASAPPHIVNINLPVATSIAFLCSPNEAISEYASMFSHDPLTASVALFYVNALRFVAANGDLGNCETVDDIIRAAEYDLPVLLPTESSISYAYSRLDQLDLGTRPLYAMTTLRVICYSLRIVHWAKQHGKRPDIARVLRHISSISCSDTSTNCAIAASIICAGCDVVGLDYGLQSALTA
jgi:hypothetical protein